MDKLYIVIPAYNEQETIQSVIEDWHPVAVAAGAESRLVIIDDGSKDNTYAMLKEAEAKLTGEGLRGYPNHTNFSLEDPRVTETEGCLVAVMEE